MENDLPNPKGYKSKGLKARLNGKNIVKPYKSTRIPYNAAKVYMRDAALSKNFPGNKALQRNADKLMRAYAASLAADTPAPLQEGGASEPTTQNGSIAQTGDKRKQDSLEDSPGEATNESSLSASPEEVKQKLLQKIRHWRTDIVAFAHAALNIKPTPQQEEILREIVKPNAKVSVRAGHGVGKTTVEAIVAIWHTLLFTDSKTAATAPSANQLRDVLMAEIGRLINSANPWIKSQLVVSNMRMEVVGKESSQFLTARTARPEQPDALQGLHAKHMLFLVDEAFGVADSVFEVARGALSTDGARVMLCGNPTATSGYAYNTHHRNADLWKTFCLNAEQSPLVSKSSIAEWEGEYGKDSDEYRVRVLGEFPRASISQLIPRELVSAACKRKLGQGAYIFQPVILGVDVAWEGDDRSVIFKRQGLASWKLWEGRNIGNIDLGNLVAQYWKSESADAVFIDVGMGTGVIDYLRHLHLAPIPVNFGSASSVTEYRYKRTEMWFGIKKWLEEGGVIPDDQALLDDLTGPNYSFLSSGQKMLEQKKMMKKRGLKSPDLGDALALTFAAPVVKKTEIEEYQNRPNVAVTDYDIFA